MNIEEKKADIKKIEQRLKDHFPTVLREIKNYEIKMNMKNYYLDLDKVRDLTDGKEKEAIHSYYRDLLMINSGINVESIFYTLYQAGYLKELRDEKITQLLS